VKKETSSGAFMEGGWVGKQSAANPPFYVCGR
jgi:hypothetical protein